MWNISTWASERERKVWKHKRCRCRQHHSSFSDVCLEEHESRFSHRIVVVIDERRVGGKLKFAWRRREKVFESSLRLERRSICNFRYTTELLFLLLARSPRRSAWQPKSIDYCRKLIFKQHFILPTKSISYVEWACTYVFRGWRAKSEIDVQPPGRQQQSREIQHDPPLRWTHVQHFSFLQTKYFLIIINNRETKRETFLISHHLWKLLKISFFFMRRRANDDIEYFQLGWLYIF